MNCGRSCAQRSAARTGAFQPSIWLLPPVRTISAFPEIEKTRIHKNISAAEHEWISASHRSSESKPLGSRSTLPKLHIAQDCLQRLRSRRRFHGKVSALQRAAEGLPCFGAFQARRSSIPAIFHISYLWRHPSLLGDFTALWYCQVPDNDLIVHQNMCTHEEVRVRRINGLRESIICMRFKNIYL